MSLAGSLPTKAGPAFRILCEGWGLSASPVAVDSVCLREWKTIFALLMQRTAE